MQKNTAQRNKLAATYKARNREASVHVINKYTQNITLCIDIAFYKDMLRNTHNYSCTANKTVIRLIQALKLNNTRSWLSTN